MMGGENLILDNIKALCREHKTNITDLEKEVGLGFGTVYKWGKVSPSVANLKLVADYFGVTVDELLKEGRLCTATTTESSSASATESC